MSGAGPVASEYSFKLGTTWHCCLRTRASRRRRKPLLRETLEAHRVTLGVKHRDTLLSVLNLARLLQAQGKLGEARPLLYEALLGRWEVLGPAHTSTLSAYTSLLSLLTAQGSAREARELKAKYGAAGK